MSPSPNSGAAQWEGLAEVPNLVQETLSVTTATPKGRPTSYGLVSAHSGQGISRPE